ncbi:MULTISPECIES: phosphoenolpyruvate--protein phosphotransferase [unclassified Bartonella]|uniref:phosphoenolpyruvate--protein phosphotransferase n=1 Tax=unclassified Bartonella TaxID=2645622 RepID=UPI0021C951E1|nr:MULTISPECIES: phosphoenolpyruvate--protein phosphotransferase [unclassified Bartonella]UXN03571.1 phosphoenolpyruvate--protein phosphotransferase [Bartonella sp. HY406]UXN06542.1 phosphoenolpyruvate--protein phosphotransferase [Bartonella sp. HY761]
MPKVETGPRLLLRRMRELMADAMEPQARLDLIVREIAHNMVTDVCSFYVLRSDAVLELYATQGLNPEAVHLVQLRLGQGLVGTIAANATPLNLSNAQVHPAFAYLPETGEEIYSSFLGVPILRAGRTLGVLVVQNREQRIYNDDEVEALETVAMVLAEMIAAGDLPRVSLNSVDIDLRRPYTLNGRALNEGIGLGTVVLHEPRIVVTNLFNEDIDLELQKLTTAMDSLRLSIDDLLARGDVAREGEHRDVLEAYRMFANDNGWMRRLEEAIRNGLSAEGAVEKVQSDTRARMLNLTDPYLRERLSDFDDLANRLLYQLMGSSREDIAASVGKDAIIVARTMGAAELLDYPRGSVRGLVLEDGAPTSHVTIVARAMGIPVVGQAKGAVSLSENGDPVIIDGEEGRLHLRPAIDVEKAYAEKARFRARRQQAYRDLRDVPALTRDGQKIIMLINAGLLVDLPQLFESGAEGVGLFRTELQFMIASTFPRSNEQEQLYRSVYKEIGDKPVTFRTLDIGGDKVLPYFRFKEQEENPALGWRAIRLTLDRPALMRTQLRALLKASIGRELRVMLPMVSDVSEIHRTRELIDREINYLDRFGYGQPTRIKLGAMVEVPGLLFQLDELMEVVDFVSVGSNDLFQFLMAVDRGNSQVANRFDQLSVPMLRVLRNIIRAGERAEKPVTLCGEMAGKPITAMALIGLGYHRISMTPSSIGPVKAMLLSLDAQDLRKNLDDILDSRDTGINMREFLLQYAEDNNISL